MCHIYIYIYIYIHTRQPGRRQGLTGEGVIRRAGQGSLRFKLCVCPLILKFLCCLYCFVSVMFCSRSQTKRGTEKSKQAHRPSLLFYSNYARPGQSRLPRHVAPRHTASYRVASRRSGPSRPKTTYGSTCLNNNRQITVNLAEWSAC